MLQAGLEGRGYGCFVWWPRTAYAQSRAQRCHHVWHVRSCPAFPWNRLRRVINRRPRKRRRQRRDVQKQESIGDMAQNVWGDGAQESTFFHFSRCNNSVRKIYGRGTIVVTKGRASVGPPKSHNSILGISLSSRRKPSFFEPPLPISANISTCVRELLIPCHFD